jgi:hypothetical protein
MLKQAFLATTLIAAAFSSASALGQVYFWRDARNIANYSDLCPIGTACNTKKIWGSSATSAALAVATPSSNIAHGITGSYASAVTTSAPINALPLQPVGGRAVGAPGLAVGSASSAASSGGASGDGASPRIAPFMLRGPYAPSTGSGASALPPSTATTSTESTASGSSSPAGLRSPIGTNLNGLSYWTTQLPFVDVMKSSSAWISGDSSAWDNGKALDLDANGWIRSLAPGQIGRRLMFREIGDRYPAGQYLVRYRGEGTMKFGFAAKVVSEKPGEMVIQVTPISAGVYLTIEQTNPANYLRDIEITMPGGICEGKPFTHVASAQDCSSDRPYLSFADHHRTILFYPVFADRLRAYSVLRFMDWMATNNSPVRTWSERTPVSYSTWATTSGAPIEVMIALANLVGAHPWFNIPHQADDAYAESLAQLIKARLDPNLRVYVEHSNEVWNSIFKQYAYVRDQAATQTPPLDNIQYHALRSRTIGQTFKAVLGESRVVAVLGAQAASRWTAAHGLEYLKNRTGPYGSLGIDAVGIAPYFGVVADPTAAAKYTAMKLDEFFAFVRTSVLPATASQAAMYRKLANEFGLSLIAYEGGQHMVGYRGAENDAVLNELFDSFNRDQRIKGLYLDYLNGWKQAGGELFVHFNDVGRYAKSGRWGALEYVAQARETAPKFDAIQGFIEKNPVWWSQ